MAEGKCVSPPCSPVAQLRLGGGLDLDLEDCARQRGRQSSKERRTKEEIVVEFRFPDGSVAEAPFQMGQTVEVLKAHLAAEFELDMRVVELEFGRNVMIDPLSLSDYASDSLEGLVVDVIMDHDDWCRESKK